MSGVGKAAALGLGAAATAFGKLAYDALKAGSEIEQNIGGTEAVFGQFADAVQKKGGEAFKNMGLSASDFMATANKMGALLQGMGFEIEESMTVSTEVMQRAADVASVMGISTSEAMEAITGAAKGNFTMMDNLGVAMNETTIAAYAASHGMGATTASSLELEEASLKVEKAQTKVNEAISKHGASSLEAREASLQLTKAQENLEEVSSGVSGSLTTQQKITAAMEMFLDKTAYAAGNYAKENETLAGALNTAKAAMSNFLSGAGDVEGIVESVSNLADVLLSKLTELLPRLTEGLGSIVQQLIPKIPPLINELLPAIIMGATALFEGLVSAMPDLMGVVSDVIPMLVEAILNMLPEMLQAGIDILASLADGITQALPKLIPAAVAAIMTLVKKLVNNIPMLVNAAIDLVMGLVKGIIAAAPLLVESIPAIIKALIDGLNQAIPMLENAAIEIVISLVDFIAKDSPAMLEAGFYIITAIAEGILEAIPELISIIPELIGALTGSIRDSDYSETASAFSGLFDAIGAYFADKWLELATNFYSDMARTVIEGFKNAWGGVAEIISDALGSAIKRANTFVADEIPAMINQIGQWFGELPYNIGYGLGEALGTFVKWVFSLKDTAKSELPKFIDEVFTFFKELPGKIWDGIITAKDKIVEWVQNLVKTAKEEVPKFVDEVIEAIKGLPEKFYEAGRNILDSFVRGIKDDLEDAKKTIGDFFQGIINGVKNKLGIHSPSKIFGDMGTNTIKSFADSVLGASGYADRAMNSVFGDLSRTVDVGINARQSAVGVPVGGVSGAQGTPSQSIVNINGPITIQAADLLEAADVVDFFRNFRRDKRAFAGG